MPEPQLDASFIRPDKAIATPSTPEYKNTAEMNPSDYKLQCEELIKVNNTLSIPNPEFVNTLKGWSPRVEEGYLGSTLNVIKNINSNRFDVSEKDQNSQTAYDSKNKLSRFKIDFVNSNSPLLRQVYSATQDEALRKEIVAVFEGQLLGANGLEVKSALEFFIDTYEEIGYSMWPVLRKYFFRKGLSWDQFRKEYNEGRDETIGDSVFKLAKKTLQNSKDFAEINATIAGVVGSTYPLDIEKEIDEILTQQVSQFGIDGYETVRAWKENQTGDNRMELFGEFVANSLNSMRIIETERPGICNVLFTEYGIRNFGRYPAVSLIAQYDNRDQQIPYGVLIYPESDYNGAFSEHEIAIEGLFRDLSAMNHGLRIYESGSRQEVVRALISADKRYGKQNKISFAVLGGHGEPDSIAMGGRRSNGDLEISQKDLENPRTKKIKDLFIEDPTLILISCSTGVEAGIGEDMSSLGVNVIAPDSSTNLDQIRAFRQRNGSLKFDVVFEGKANAAHFPKESKN